MISSRSLFAIVFAVLICLGTLCITRTTAATINAPASDDEARRIKPDEARELLKANKAVLVDVRGAATYKAAHIKGALNIPFNEIVDRAGELPRDKLIITYCS